MFFGALSLEVEVRIDATMTSIFVSILYPRYGNMGVGVLRETKWIYSYHI